AAVFGSLGPDAAKYNAKIGSALASAWLKRLGELPSDSADFKKALEAWFKGPFSFADEAELTIKDNEALLHVAGCDICRGNEILRNSGKKGCCPISQMVKSALGRGLKKPVELSGSEKPGPVGECYLKYNISKSPPHPGGEREGRGDG
ncbi:MAG: hypothetical protein AAB356_03630, partial [Deltaproteobacteria bacterium]